MIEPVVLVHSQRKKSYAIGRKLSTEDIRDFGKISHEMGFNAKIRKEYGFF
jgi:predicted amino acid dehydrogenase